MKKKTSKRNLALGIETIRTLTNLDGVVGGFQAGSQVTSQCNSCAFTCDWSQCQPPPSGVQGGAQ